MIINMIYMADNCQTKSRQLSDVLNTNKAYTFTGWMVHACRTLYESIY